MFDFGFSEMFVVAVVALLVLGPERLPKAARFAGLWVRRARAQWHSVRSELENELADDDLKRSLRRMQDELAAAREQLREGGDSLKRGLDGFGAIADPAQPPTPQPGDPVPDAPPQRDPEPDSPPQHDPAPDESPRREPGQPGPEKREPDPRSPDHPDPPQKRLGGEQ